MIARMEKLYIVGPKGLAPSLLQQLQRVGVVQIDQAPKDDVGEYQLPADHESRLRGWESVATSAIHTLRLLGLDPDPSVKPFDGSIDAAEAMVAPRERRAAELVESIEGLRSEIEFISYFSDVVKRLADAVQGLDGSPRLAVLPFVIERGEDTEPLEQELRMALGDRFLLVGSPVGAVVASVVTVMKRDADEARGALGRRGLSEIPRTGEYARMSLRTMAARLSDKEIAAPEEEAARVRELEALAGEYGEMMQAVRNRALDEAAQLQVFRQMASGRYGFALFGWVPSILKGKIEDLIPEFEDRVLYRFEPAAEHEEAQKVPVLLDNRKWVKPFESLVSFLNTPRYDGWDPTFVIAVLFPLWFGMIVGDIGYGLVFLGLAWYLGTYIKRKRALNIDYFKLRLAPSALAQIVSIMKPMIAWTFVWGIFYGEFFGDLLEQFGILGTAHHPGILPVLIPRTETARSSGPLILLSIGFGVIQVLHGFYLKAGLMRRRAERKHFWEATGYLGGVTFLILFAWAFMSGNLKGWLLIPMLLAAAIFIAGMILARMPLMIAELPTQGGHILSYIRIYAVGLASAILANLATEAGVGLSHLLGSAGIVLGVLVGVLLGLITHAVLLVLLTVSHVLQPIRLIWVEFFTKFDFYTLSGRPYRPFRSTGAH